MKPDSNQANYLKGSFFEIGIEKRSLYYVQSTFDNLNGLASAYSNDQKLNRKTTVTISFGFLLQNGSRYILILIYIRFF